MRTLLLFLPFLLNTMTKLEIGTYVLQVQNLIFTVTLVFCNSNIFLWMSMEVTKFNSNINRNIPIDTTILKSCYMFFYGKEQFSPITLF